MSREDLGPRRRLGRLQPRDRPLGLPVAHLGLRLTLLKFPTGSHRLSRPDQHVRASPPLPALLEVPPGPLPLGFHESVEKDVRELNKRRLLTGKQLGLRQPTASLKSSLQLRVRRPPRPPLKARLPTFLPVPRRRKLHRDQRFYRPLQRQDSKRLSNGSTTVPQRRKQRLRPLEKRKVTAKSLPCQTTPRAPPNPANAEEKPGRENRAQLPPPQSQIEPQPRVPPQPRQAFERTGSGSLTTSGSWAGRRKERGEWLPRGWRGTRGVWGARGGSWSGAGDRGRARQWASAVSGFMLFIPASPTCLLWPGLKDLCLDLGLEPQAALCARVEGPGSRLCGVEPVSAHSRPRETG